MKIKEVVCKETTYINAFLMCGTGAANLIFSISCDKIKKIRKNL